MKTEKVKMMMFGEEKEYLFIEDAEPNCKKCCFYNKKKNPGGLHCTDLMDFGLLIQCDEDGGWDYSGHYEEVK